MDLDWSGWSPIDWGALPLSIRVKPDRSGWFQWKKLLMFFFFGNSCRDACCVYRHSWVTFHDQRVSKSIDTSLRCPFTIYKLRNGFYVKHTWKSSSFSSLSYFLSKLFWYCFAIEIKSFQVVLSRDWTTFIAICWRIS